MKKEEKKPEEKRMFDWFGTRKDAPAVTEEMALQGKKKNDERRKQPKDGKMFWERKKE